MLVAQVTNVIIRVIELLNKINQETDCKDKC